MTALRPTYRALTLVLPVSFALHVAEEAPGFVAWFNARIEPDINPRMFWYVNATAFAVTLAVAAMAAASRERVVAVAATAWIGFLMLANGLFHVAAATVERGYVPGVVTGALVYLPVSLAFMRAASRQCDISILRYGAHRADRRHADVCARLADRV